jgi:sterol desaturase/sphingolipid hydroxylase (fatty acid hydroxylase superfamily)
MKPGLLNCWLRNRAFVVYGPLIAASALWLFGGAPLSAFAAVAFWTGGLLAWTLIEWSAHRAMHVQTRIGWISRVQDAAHLRHHREPADLEHGVIRLSASLPLAGLVFAAAWLGIGEVSRATAFQCGVLTGYLFYEFVHLTAHAPKRLPGLRGLHRRHNLHHFVDSRRSFGVTNGLWDWLFGTLPVSSPPARTAQSAPRAPTQ